MNALIDSEKHKYDNEYAENVAYYKYVIENVRKYNSKWLTEEVYQLMIKNKENVENLKIKKKQNIAEYIYNLAGDFGVNLVLENKDISFKSWIVKNKIKNLNKIEL